ncbi:phage holin family protein [Cutibacterium granulosum]|uniref:phage holin family protein n=1 Tax=Cutibacterium granulosum TaxID=33011 RepID=UPI002B221D1D|nr:phage holin family protein [Cutibacterium granulosum]MEA5655288.1 phage holin family protein [Cutibacterium granulosum]
MAEKRPVSEIMATLKTDGPALVKENVALAKAEIKPAVKHAGIGGGMFAGAGYFAVIGANMMWLCGAFALTLAWHAAVSSILLALVLGFASTAVALFLIAGVAALVGKVQVSKVQPPRQSVEEAKRTVGTLKSAVSRGVDNAGATNEVSA